MKRRIALMLVLCFSLLAAVSCGGGAKESAAETPAEKAPVAEEKAPEAVEKAETKEEAVVNNVESPFLKALELYKDTFKSLPKDSYFAFVNMDEEHDALLITTEDNLFGEEQKKLSTEATVYAPDKDGNIKDYGKVFSGGTAYPFVANKGKLYYGNHTQLISAYINESASEMVETVEAELEGDGEDEAALEAFEDAFSVYYEGSEIYFSPISMALEN